ncbi:hypothetical protein ACQ4PT_014549 [Festuca glaucescens]
MARVCDAREKEALHIDAEDTGPAAAQSPGGVQGLTRPNTEELLDAIQQPITPGLVPLERSPHTPPSRPRRTKKRLSTATRRSHHVKNRKEEVTGGGNNTMKLARKLIISKRGLAIAEKGEESDDEVVGRYEAAFEDPLSPAQMGALSALAKGASRRGRRAGGPPPSKLVAPVKFRFENVWVQREDFLAVVYHAWRSCPSQLDPFVNLHAKLSSTARALRSWSSQFTNDLELRAAISSELIFRLDKAMDSRALSAEEMQFRAMLKMNCLGIAAMQRTMWRQRSRIQWLREGDANTHFFHAKASARRRKSYIHRVELDNVSYTEQQDKEEAVWKFFHDMLGQARPRKHSINLEALGIIPVDLTDQELPISPEEVRAAITDLPSDKAPGSDGYTALFFKKCWHLISNDIMRAIRALESATSRNLHLLNPATMILLPKTPDAAHPKDFRPISLVHFFAKLFTKILALRLRLRMHELVGPCQSAFIKQRVIHDNFVFVRAHAKLFRQTKTPTLLLKMDLQKAFDSIS